MSLYSLFRLGHLIRDELNNGGVFERLNAPLKSLSSIHFVQFRKTIEGIGPVYGLATHSELKFAQIIAYFEYLDRKAVLSKRPSLGIKSTNGVAAHTFRFLAERAAQAELCERDSVLAHWYTQIPMEPLAAPIGLSSAISELTTLGLRSYFLTTNLGFKATQVCLLVNASTGGFVTGSASGRGISADANKAFLEAVINLFFGGYGKSSEELMTRFDRTGFADLQAHRTYWLNRASCPNWLLAQKVIKGMKLKAFRPTFKSQLIESKPFPVVAVESPDLLEFKCGRPVESDYICLTNRLQEPYDFPVGMPHPLF